MATAFDPQANFQELLHYCRERLGGSRLASQRELADALEVAPTMAGRYIAGGTDFYHLRATTVANLAAAAGLDVGSVYLWVERGRRAAAAHQERLSRKPLRFSALDYIKEAAALLESGSPDAVPAPPPPDYSGLQQALAERRGPEGDARTSLFDTLVQHVDAEAVLQRIAQRQPLSDEDWLKLQMLLSVPAAELQQCYGFGQSAARTEPLPA